MFSEHYQHLAILQTTWQKKKKIVYPTTEKWDEQVSVKCGTHTLLPFPASLSPDSCCGVN